MTKRALAAALLALCSLLLLSPAPAQAADRQLTLTETQMSKSLEKLQEPGATPGRRGWR